MEISDSGLFKSAYFTQISTDEKPQDDHRYLRSSVYNLAIICESDEKIILSKAQDI